MPIKVRCTIPRVCMFHLVDIVQRIKAVESPPCRPDIPEGTTGSDESRVVDLLTRCWDENQEHRPSFVDVLKTMLGMNRGR